MIKERLVKLRFGEMTSLFYVVKTNFRLLSVHRNKLQTNRLRHFNFLTGILQ